MGWIDKFLSGGLTSVVDFGLQALANSVLPMSRAQRQQNEFSSQEARAARDFSAQQAELSRDWQEQMYDRFNSLQGKINQANEAGVNPLFALGASANMSPSSPNVAAPAAGGGSVSPVGQISDMTSSALGFGKLKAEIDNMKASTRQMNAIALNNEIDSITRGDINNATLNQALKAIEVADVDIQYKTQQISDLVSQIDFRSIQGETEAARQNLFAGQLALVNAQVVTEAFAQAESFSRRRVNEMQLDVMSATIQQSLKQIDLMDADISVKRYMCGQLISETFLNYAKKKNLWHQDKVLSSEVMKISQEVANAKTKGEILGLQKKVLELSPSTNDSGWFDFTRWLGDFTGALSASTTFSFAN